MTDKLKLLFCGSTTVEQCDLPINIPLNKYNSIKFPYVYDGKLCSDLLVGKPFISKVS